MADFSFDDGTSFESHKGSEPAPPRRKPGRPRTKPPVELPPEVGSAPLPTPDGLPAKPKRGNARTGRWPLRRPPAERTKQRPHGWALSGAWRPIYLEWLERTGIKSRSADKAGVSLATVGSHQKADPEFDAACQEAMERYADGVEAEVARRAIEGDEKFVWDKKAGEMVSVGKVPNDILLMFYMKKIRPSFRENYKSDDDKAAAQALQNIVVSFLRDGFDRDSDGQADAPTLEAYVKEQAALPPPETAGEKRARLLRELAELDAEPEIVTPDADA